MGRSPEAQFPIRELHVGRNVAVAVAAVAAIGGELGIALLAGLAAGGAHMVARGIEQKR